MLRITSKLSVLVMVVILSACQTGTYGVIDGSRSLADNNNFPVRIMAIDGKALFSDNESKSLPPGLHTLVLETTKEVRGRAKPEQTAISIEVAPCTRYFISAQHKHDLSEKWTPKVIDTKQIQACTPTVAEN